MWRESPCKTTWTSTKPPLKERSPFNPPPWLSHTHVPPARRRLSARWSQTPSPNLRPQMSSRMRPTFRSIPVSGMVTSASPPFLARTDFCEMVSTTWLHLFCAWLLSSTKGNWIIETATTSNNSIPSVKLRGPSYRPYMSPAGTNSTSQTKSPSEPWLSRSSPRACLDLKAPPRQHSQERPSTSSPSSH